MLINGVARGAAPQSPALCPPCSECRRNVNKAGPLLPSTQHREADWRAGGPGRADTGGSNTQEGLGAARRALRGAGDKLFPGHPASPPEQETRSTDSRKCLPLQVVPALTFTSESTRSNCSHQAGFSSAYRERPRTPAKQITFLPSMFTTFLRAEYLRKTSLPCSTFTQNQRGGRLLTRLSKRTSLLRQLRCCRAPLSPGRSWGHTANGCHLPARRFPAHCHPGNRQWMGATVHPATPQSAV